MTFDKRFARIIAFDEYIISLDFTLNQCLVCFAFEGIATIESRRLSKAIQDLTTLWIHGLTYSL